MIVVGGPTYSQLLSANNKIQAPFSPENQPKQSPFFIKKITDSFFAWKPLLPGNFYSRQLGFFCKQEIKMDKATKIAFRFRLGSVEQCNRLEGKNR